MARPFYFEKFDSFLIQLVNLEKENPFKAIDHAINQVNAMKRNGDFSLLNELIINFIRFDHLCLEVYIGVLKNTRKAKGLLPNRNELYDKAMKMAQDQFSEAEAGKILATVN